MSHSDCDLGVFRKSYVFQYVNFFLTTVLAGTILTQLDALLTTTTIATIVTLLAVNIPTVATQLLNYVILRTFIVAPLSALNVLDLSWGTIKQQLLQPVTAMDIATASKSVSLSYGENQPQDLLIFIIGCSYAVVSPVVVPFVFAFSAVAYCVNKVRSAADYFCALPVWLLL